MEATPNLNAHAALVRFQAFAQLSQAELSAMMPMVRNLLHLRKGAFLQEEGRPSSSVYLLLEGWTASSVMMADGKRHLLKVHMPGDLIGLPGLSVTKAPDSVVALTDVSYGQIDLNAFGSIFRDYPRVAALLFLISQEERLMLMDRLAIVGQRETPGRVAGMILQLHARLVRQDPTIGDTFHVPLTQADLGDMVGATSVHVSRTLTDLRKRGIMDWSRQQVVIYDEPALRAISGLPKRLAARDWAWLPKARSD